MITHRQRCGKMLHSYEIEGTFSVGKRKTRTALASSNETDSSRTKKIMLVLVAMTDSMRCRLRSGYSAINNVAIIQFVRYDGKID